MDIHQPELLCSHHEHKLVWFPRGERYYCSGCKEEGGTGGYQCTLASCADFMLRPACAGLPDVYKKPNHVGEELDFRSRTKIPHHNCSACHNAIGGFLFKAPRRQRSLSLLKPSLRFHPLCITLPPSLTFTKHKDHTLKLVKDKDGDYSCGFCSRKSRGWRYDCKGCRYNIDLTCAKLDMQGLDHPSQDPADPQEGNRNDILNATTAFAGSVAAAVAGGVLTQVIGDAVIVVPIFRLYYIYV